MGLRASFRLHSLLFLILFFALNPSRMAFGRTDSIKKGELDLKNWANKNPIHLEGEWYFFWKELLTPTAIVARLQTPGFQPNFASVGQRFQEIRNDGVKGDIGYGSYALVLHNLPASPLSLANLTSYNSGLVYLFEISAAEEAQPLVRIGQVGSSASATRPAIAMKGLANFQPVANKTYILLVQVANFHLYWGGMWTPPTLASTPYLAESQASNARTGNLIMGMFIILFFYNFSFYLRRREDKSSLYLALFGLIVLLRTYVIQNWSANEFDDFNLSYAFHFKAIYLTQPGIVLTFTLFLRSCFPRQMPVWLMKTPWVVYAVPCLIVLLTPTIVHSHLSYFFKWTGMATVLIGFAVMFRAFRAGEEGAKASMLGGSIFLFTAMIDILSTLGLVRAPENLSGLGLVVFSAFQSQIVAIRFAIAFRRSEHLSRSLSEEVERQTRDIKSILKNIRQGIFTLVHPSKRVGDQYSDHLKVLLGKDEVVGQTLEQLLLDQSDLSGDSKSQINSVLDASLGEPDFAFEANENNLVHELRYHKRDDSSLRILEIDWNPIVNKHSEVEKILVSFRDVTEVRRLKLEAEQREEDMRILIELIQIPEEKFQRFMAKTKEYIAENREIVTGKMVPRSDVIKRLFMNMHTIKGAARTYSLKAISTVAHEVEQYYAALQQDGVEWDFDKLIYDLDEIHKVISHYQEVGEDRLGWSMCNRIVKIDKAQLEDFLRYVLAMNTVGLSSEQMQHFWGVAHRLSRLCYEPLMAFISEASRGLDSIARDLRKEVPLIVVPNSQILMTDEGGALIHAIFVHLFRNSMDHGIEWVDLRRQRAKDPQGTITIDCNSRQESILLNFRDDGNGLDLIAIEARGRERGLLQPQQQVSDTEIASLIFESGFSTKNAVSEISGRGVGLDAVRTFCLKAGAQISIKLEVVHDRQQAAFSFEMAIPKTLYWHPDHR